MKDLNFYSVLKFGCEKDMFDLYENGTIFLNTLQFFNKLEDKGLRGDNYEGVLQVTNFPPGKFNIMNDGKPLVKNLNYQSLHLRKSYQKLYGNLYCLYAIRPQHLQDQDVFRFDERLKQLGSHFLMITNDGIQKFIDKLFDKLDIYNLKFEYGFVDYYNKFSINSEVTSFMKPDEFSYQNEFRIFVDYKTNEPLILKMGGLTSIATIFETKILPNMTFERDKLL